MTIQNELSRLFYILLYVVFVSLLLRLINSKKKWRGRQALMPVAAVVYALAGIVFLTIEYHIIVRPGVYFHVLNGSAGAIANLLLMTAFIPIKLILLPILTGLLKAYHRMELFAGSFYQYDDELEMWFLHEEQKDTRIIVKDFAWASVFISAFLIFLSWTGAETGFKYLYIIPSAVMIVLWEIYYFLSGPTRQEYVVHINGESSTSQKWGKYYVIREIYERFFPGQILSAHTGCEFLAREGATNLLREYETSADPIQQVEHVYFSTCEDSKKLNTDYIQATDGMMHGKNVIFFDPFYQNLGPYIILPMMDALLKSKKCLLICGRQSLTEDVSKWLKEQIYKYSKLERLWRVGQLGNNAPVCEIGVLDFCQLYDPEVMDANRAFMEEVGFVLMFEPSLMVNTGQIGLSIVVEELESCGNDPVYCICDRYTDGIVDTMSHLLKTEITDVVALPLPRCVYSGVAWNADGDYMRQRLFNKQTRFMGNGVELAAVAVKNQIPKVTWYGETKAPLRDIRWQAGQNYAAICRYMNINVQQKSLYERIEFVSSLWSAPLKDEQFLLVEDEFRNIFTMMRLFLSRSEEQAFVNILSENYLLRDYMRCNQEMLRGNPYAIPSIVPDYVRSVRNAFMKLLIQMTTRWVPESEVQDELELVGVYTSEVFQALADFLRKYTKAPAGIIQIRMETREEDILNVHQTAAFHMAEEDFEKYFAESLKTAFYIVEDEKRNREYIDAKLFGHVTQMLLPGQFVCYDGKYYMAERIEPSVGVLLRRASDHYDERLYYRQMRHYKLTAPVEEDRTYDRTFMDIQISCFPMNVDVMTPGYLQLSDAGNLRTAREVRFGEDQVKQILERSYIRKNVLRIRFVDTDESVRFTFCVLFAEMLRSLFPNAWEYIAILTKTEKTSEGMLNYMLYDVEGDLEEDAVYIVEDSDMDLGLLDAILRNYDRIMELMADFLDWHFEKIREIAYKDPVKENLKVPEETVQEIKKQNSIFSRFQQRIRRMFHREEEKAAEEAAAEEAEENKPAADEPQKEAAQENTPETTETPASTDSDTEAAVDSETSSDAEETSEVEKTEEETEDVSSEVEEADATAEEETETEQIDIHLPEDEQIIVHEEGEDLFAADGAGDDLDILMPIKPTRYQQECFIKFGFDEIDRRLELKKTAAYLTMHGWGDSDLSRARKRIEFGLTNLDLEAENHCDFCGMPLSGASFEVLGDGRIRCHDCSTSAISDVEEFKEIFQRCYGMLEDTYKVRMRVNVNVQTTDAKTVAKQAGIIFKPSSGFAGRALGFARKDRNGYSIVIENGSPRLAAIDTITHELTHLWQYLNWNDNEIYKIYNQGNKIKTKMARDMIYEGMAMWSAIQMLYILGERYYANIQEIEAANRTDIYGIGFRLFRSNYQIERSGNVPLRTPFGKFPPIDPAEVRELFGD